jgi:ribonuclease HI
MPEHKLPKVIIYTDGACSGNPGPGGWGAVLIWGDKEKEIYGGEPATTNNRMELTAAIQALRELKMPCHVDLYSDSSYVCNGMKEWVPNWKKRAWKTSDNKLVKNADLWQMLDDAAARHQVKWHWVKGHNGDMLNERADALARMGIEY